MIKLLHSLRSIVTNALLGCDAYVLSSEAPVAYKAAAYLLKGLLGARVQVCDGTADEVEINAAIASGYHILLGSGTFTVAATASLSNKENVWLQGSGPGVTTIKVAADAQVNAIECIATAAKYRVTISDLYIDGNKGNITQGASQYVQNGIFLRGNGGVIYSAVIRNVYSYYNCWHGILVVGSVQRAVIQNVHAVSNGDTDGSGIRLEAQSWIVTGCVAAQNGDWGIYQEGTCYGGIVSNNYCDANTDGGIYLACTGTSLPTRVVVIGNRVYGTSADGILLLGATNSVVVGNVLGGGLTRGIGVYSAASDASSSGILVTGNVISGCTTGVRLYDTGTGVSADVLAQGNLFSGNTANLSVSLAVGATYRVSNNLGLVTESSGLATILSGATSVVVTHGLGITPSLQDIQVMAAENSTNDAGPLYVSTITSTQFTINCRADPGASNLDVVWQASKNRLITVA